ncbi:MAG TPA: hypothetical protein VKU82_05845 [Planctomycetaceae bacterium]|nr:hypothetical protein [Planctomycetaceae bacterium]
MPSLPELPRRPLTVYKIGGSVCDVPQLPRVIERLLEQRKTDALLIAGGGAAADVIREWDRVHCLGNDAAHELALEAMMLSTSLLARLFPKARLVRSEQQVRMAADDGKLALLCAGCFIKAAEAGGHAPLERSWQVTSDSIAAWTAKVLAVSELVLVKSIDAPRGLTLADASQAGLVDERFPEMACDLPAIGWANARDERPQIVAWRTLSPGELNVSAGSSTSR